jgi:GntR family transcriptional regulator
MLDRTNPEPLYSQFDKVIRAKIASGEWSSDRPIPSENELSRTYGISRVTVRAVITQFVREGLLYRVQGKGTFICKPKIEAKPMSYAGIREQLEQMGYEINTKVIGLEAVGAFDPIIEKLQLESHEMIYVLKRLRLIKDEPLSLHTSYLPYSLCNNLSEQELEKEQLCHLLKVNYNLAPKRMVETLESTTASQMEANLLDVKAGSSLLLLEDTLYLDSGKPFEYTKILFRSDKIKIKLEFNGYNYV